MSEENKKVTVKELQTFIEAVEFAADVEDWIPSERQWKRIRQMIDNLVDQPAPAPNVAPSSPPLALAVPPGYRSDVPVRHAASGLASLPPAPPPNSQLFGGAGTVRTPDIDTSTGAYTSSFA